MTTDDEMQDVRLAEMAAKALERIRITRLNPSYKSSDGDPYNCPPVPCDMCRGPMDPELHVHSFETADPVDVAALVSNLEVPADVTGAVQRFYDNLGQQVSAAFCSEECAIRWQNGEPTEHERRYAMEHPATFIFTHADEIADALEREGL